MSVKYIRSSHGMVYGVWVYGCGLKNPRMQNRMKPDKSHEDCDKHVSRYDLGCGEVESLELGLPGRYKFHMIDMSNEKRPWLVGLYRG